MKRKDGLRWGRAKSKRIVTIPIGDTEETRHSLHGLACQLESVRVDILEFLSIYYGLRSRSHEYERVANMTKALTPFVASYTSLADTLARDAASPRSCSGNRYRDACAGDSAKLHPARVGWASPRQTGDP